MMLDTINFVVIIFYLETTVLEGYDNLASNNYTMVLGRSIEWLFNSLSGMIFHCIYCFPIADIL